MYQEVGEILAKYRSGKVPKAFKVIAQFRNWEDLLILTKPENWSAAAVYQATRIFTANLKEKFAQRYLLTIKTFQGIFKKWYFVTKIVLTYCEKKLF